jgi:hypothetical protein
MQVVTVILSIISCIHSICAYCYCKVSVGHSAFHLYSVKGSVNYKRLFQLSTHLDLIYRFIEKRNKRNTFLADRILADDNLRAIHFSTEHYFCMIVSKELFHGIWCLRTHRAHHESAKFFITGTD